MALPASARLLRPLLTSRSANCSSPFRAQCEISPGKRIDLRCTVAGYTPHSFGRWSFAVVRPLAPECTASNPIPVRRPAASAPHFFQPRPRGLRLVVCSRFLRPGFSKDFHLLAFLMLGTHRDRGGGNYPAGPLPHHRTCGSASGGSES